MWTKAIQVPVLAPVLAPVLVPVLAPALVQPLILVLAPAPALIHSRALAPVQIRLLVVTVDLDQVPRPMKNVNPI